MSATFLQLMLYLLSSRGFNCSGNIGLAKKFISLFFLGKVIVAQSCLTLCDPMDCSPQGFSVQGILQARILDWLSFPSPGDLPCLGTEPGSSILQADSLSSEPYSHQPVRCF